MKLWPAATFVQNAEQGQTDSLEAIDQLSISGKGSNAYLHSGPSEQV